jgi:translation initiation factor eIF-2B subunit epsilon
LIRLGAFRYRIAHACGLAHRLFPFVYFILFHFISGDDFDDLVPSDRGSVTSEDESSDETDNKDDDDVSQSASVSSSVTSAPLALEEEFQTEVRLSLDRAFSEGHSLENASVELKTLRMASNVPLRRVREAVVAGIVERIPVVEGAAPQRAEIKKWVDRWGNLINLIGGVDGIETVSILQVGPFFLLFQVVLDRAHNYL